jgi:limonene-1,2-epoxide hydrolase
MRWVLMAVLALSGCATTAAYEGILRSFVGTSETELVRQWGPPASVYQNEDARFLTYNRAGQAYIPGTAPTMYTTQIGNTYQTQAVGGMSAMLLAMNCTTTFELHDGKVTNWRWQGNYCKAREQ